MTWAAAEKGWGFKVASPRAQTEAMMVLELRRKPSSWM